MNKINVTDARKDMSTFFDSVIHEKPIVLKKRKYEAVLIEKSLLKVFLSNEKITVKTVTENSDKVILMVPELDIFGEAETRVDALTNLCENLFNYAHDVYNNFMFYYYGQNIKTKLGLVFHILLCEDFEQLKELMVFQQKKQKKTKN